MLKPALDEELIAELSSLLGAGFDDFVTVFLADTRDRLAALRTAAAGRDRVQLQELAHLLKGSVSNAGAMNLSGLFAGLESLDRQATSGEIDRQIDAVETEFLRVAEELQAWRRS